MNPMMLAALTAALGVVIGAVLTRRWRPPAAAQVAEAVKLLGGSGSVTVFVGLLIVFGAAVGVGFGALGSVLHEMLTGHPINPSTFWERTLDTVMLGGLALAGIGGGVKIGHRATTKPDVITAEAQAEQMRAEAGRASGLRDDVP